jgi:N-acylglucosamine-6-phosphate 2-epimerase
MSLLDALRGGLIVSVQAWRDSALNDAHVIAAMAAAAQEGGAVAVRVAGVDHLKAVRARVSLPVIGIVKSEYPGYEPYITATLNDVRSVIAAGPEIVAFDATERPRPDGSSVEDAVVAIHAAGRLAMADCATAAQGGAAAEIGADIIATTLCGYTSQTAGRPLPALDLVAQFAQLTPFTICEGGVRAPAQVRAALDAGAHAVVVGTAITNVDWLVREFAGAAERVS